VRFVLDRKISDNILLAKELLRDYHLKSYLPRIAFKRKEDLGKVINLLPISFSWLWRSGGKTVLLIVSTVCTGNSAFAENFVFVDDSTYAGNSVSAENFAFVGNSCTGYFEFLHQTLKAKRTTRTIIQLLFCSLHSISAYTMECTELILPVIVKRFH
ncbi:hypothetical protein AKJ16_DCAP26292, partial [Drosera capensis]